MYPVGVNDQLADNSENEEMANSKLTFSKLISVTTGRRGLGLQMAFALAFLCQHACDADSPGKPPVPIDNIYRPAIHQAEQDLLKKLKATIKSDPCSAARIASTLAAYEFAEERYSDASSHLRHSEKLLSSRCAAQQQFLVSVKKHLGDCEFFQDRIGQSIENYESALKGLQAQDPALEASILKALSEACLRHKKYERGAELLQRLELLQKSAHDPTIGWTYISLKDAFELLSKPAESDRYFAQAVEVFRPLADAPAAPPPPEPPAVVPIDLWQALETEPLTMPVTIWRNRDSKPWALVLCIHGMGLHKESFADFAAKLSERGVLVAALDVRGFGAWSKHRNQKIDFSRSASDVAHISAALKSLNPGIPLFILGESMGGAIALQSAVGCPAIDAVVSAVPAADRYNGTESMMKVAWQMLTRPGSEYDITDDVVNKVSHDEKVVESWKNDRDARFKIGTGELVAFDQFMRDTKEQVKKLAKPVLIAQGGADPLVKPSSTSDLYDAVKVQDKTLIMLGTKEHLIFETDHFSNVLLDGLVAWLKAHTNPGSTSPVSN